MLHNPTSFVKTNQEQRQQKRKSKQEQESKRATETHVETQDPLLGEKVPSTVLSLEEQLERFADLLIDELLKQAL